MSGEQVPNEYLREKFKWAEEYEGLTLSELAYRIGYVNKTKKGGVCADVTSIARLLGLKPTHRGDYADKVSYKDAIALCKGLHIDYYEMGL